MYFNEKNDTNIDDQFKKEKKIPKIFDIFSKYKKIIFISLGVILLLIIALIIIININKGAHLILNGEETITIYQGTDYIEPGYNAYNSKKEDLTKEVTIESNLNNNVVGEYEIVYKFKNITKTRYIKVIKNYTIIYLTTVNNKIDIHLKKGEKYKEPGYTATTSNGEDLTSKVKVSGKVNTSKEGMYILTYSVVDASGETTSVSRKVYVEK